MNILLSSIIVLTLLCGCSSPNGVKMKNQIKYPEAFAKLRTDAPALRFPVVMPIYGNDDEKLTQTVSLIQHIYETAGLTEFAICFPLNPQGDDPDEKPQIFAKRFAKLKKCVTNPEIKLGVLMQQTIGMSATWNKNPNLTLPWQRTVTMKNAPSIRFCPLDPDFRKYIRKATSGIFASKPDFVIWDDDTRLYIQNQVECFCPRHVEHFNKKYGTTYTPSELQQTIKNAPGGADIIKKFADARRETLVGFVSMVRAELDRYNPQAHGIYCTNGGHLNDMPYYAKAAAGKNISAMRVANGAYLEKSVRNILLKQPGAQQIVIWHRDQIDELLDESDTCPHNLFSKSAHTMNFHIIFGLLHGLDGGKLWITNTRFYDPEPIVKFPQTIGRNQGLYRELHRTLKGVKWQGGQLTLPPPWSDPRPDFPGSYRNLHSWDTRVTTYFGLPHRYAKPSCKGIHMFAGKQIDYFTDSELESFLADGCILDAAAAAKLVERGFADLVGVKPERITEKIAAGEWMKCFDYPVRTFGSRQYELITVDKNNPPEYLSEFRDRDYYQSTKSVKVCDGAAMFKNARGAKIVTVPFEVCDSRISLVPERQNYMRRIFDLMGILPAWSPEPFDVYFRFGNLPSGQDIAAVCNISYEPMREVRIGVKKVPAKIEKLAKDGGWDVCNFTVKENIISIADLLRCADVGIYKFTY